MKKLYILSIVILFAIPFTYAQPSFNFETGWTNNPVGTPAFENPGGWATANALSINFAPLGLNGCGCSADVSVFKSTDAHGGTYACKIKTIAYSNTPSWWTLNDTVGLIMTGATSTAAPYITFGYSYALRPSTLEFWAKYTPSGADTASAAIVLLRDNGPARDTIGWAYYPIATTTVSVYTKYTVPIFYNTLFPSTNPDTVIIAFASSGDNNPKENSELLIDDIFLGFSTDINDDSETGKVTFFPNPSNREIRFSFSDPKAETVSVMNITGQEVGSFTVDNKSLKINTDQFSAGVYLFSVKNTNGTTIKTGRFTVTH